MIMPKIISYGIEKQLLCDYIFINILDISTNNKHDEVFEFF